LKAVVAFFATTIAILSPFILTGTLPAYFQAQAQASVHTLMSAQNPNLPWLISLVIRISERGIFDEESFSALPYHIDNQALRQRIYLLFATLTILAVLVVLISWSRKYGRENISALYAGALAISAYNLLSFGVHENHVFMLVPILFAISSNSRMKRIYFICTSALGLNLLATGGLGLSVPSFPLLTGTNSLAYSILGIGCLVGYGWAFFELIRSDPSRK
jgi:hypothetical protein